MRPLATAELKQIRVGQNSSLGMFILLDIYCKNVMQQLLGLQGSYYFTLRPWLGWSNLLLNKKKKLFNHGFCSQSAFLGLI